MAIIADMTEYRTMAEGALRASRALGARRVVSNRGPAHARAVTDVLVSNADSRLSFLCGRFSPEIFDAAKLREFLERPGTRMQVLLDRAPEAGHGTALADLTSYMAGDDPRLQVRRLDRAASVHLGIADERDARIETDVESRKATVVFGDPAFAKAASQRFKTLWDAAKAVTAPEVLATR